MKTIALTRNRETVVDDEDFLALSVNSWCCSKGGYATCKRNNRIVFMHRVIMGDPELFVDHINGNKLDNRKQNLRIVTHSQNSKNRSKNSGARYKGVGFEKRSNSWRARIRVDYQHIYLGNFPSAEEAAKAYNEAAILYHGEFAKLNKGDF